MVHLILTIGHLGCSGCSLYTIRSSKSQLNGQSDHHASLGATCRFETQIEYNKINSDVGPLDKFLFYDKLIRVYYFALNISTRVKRKIAVKKSFSNLCVSPMTFLHNSPETKSSM